MRKTQDFVMNSSENECLTIGSVIKVVDIHKDTYKGTVRSFDLSSRILSIETPSPSVAQLSDIYFFNLDYVANIVILEAKQGPAEPLPHVNVTKIAQRLAEQERDRQKQKSYIGVGVSPEGQRLMNTISKTISDCRWHNHDIIVLGEVTIKPPYGPKDLECVDGSKARPHIKKIVEKHCEEEAKKGRGTSSQR
ncbi:hypothetical protein RRG08_060592 [Elysia crispata]|uniref:AD domain-containing protein n=1 Tax=Elysia crispata TaxID=231223 RepID=A0AAE1E1W5_9GAST|nr:hypothetical protein RRG08_060592 [Elysia crispata]